MIKVTVKNLALVTIAQGLFSNQTQVNDWISKNQNSKSWGEPERWIEDSKLAGLGLNSNDAIDSAIVQNPYPAPGEPSQFTMWKFPVEYSITQEDVTTAQAEEQAKKDSIAAIDLGLQIVADVRALNKSKLIAGTMTTADFTALMQDQTAAAIERFLWTGSFQSAKATLLSWSQTYYTTAERDKIVAKIDAAIALGV